MSASLHSDLALHLQSSSSSLCLKATLKIMASFFRRLARATSPIAFGNAYGGQSNSTHGRFRMPLGAIAAVSGGVSYLYYYSSPSLVHLEEVKEDKSQDTGDYPTWHSDQVNGSNLSCKRLPRFSFDPDKKLGLNIASCILTRAQVGQDAEGKPNFAVRPYTPISDPESKGYFDLLIKIYPGGQMTQHLASLKPGDVLEVNGPMDSLKYTPNMKKHIGMVAGGTGLTPMLQVIEAILKNPDDKTQISFLYANNTPDDILLKQKLDLLAASHPNFKVYYTVSSPSKTWKGGVGHISKDMAEKGLPNPSDDTLILVCGPPGFMKHVSGEKANWAQGELSGLLKDLGYTEQMVFKF
ncbi:NADH-cytochrome b5 reductase-like protein [Senna tora]|uniref:NADH-cytochrome b5 reductase n=1 Tax=Senna tora TaxID=362788 RepID=A0A834X746_9FABA|nr:NADH-cytochrome b5 reductase-like protein [Senna tora]